MKNVKETTKEDLLTIIQKFDSLIDTSITIVALGGTALTLLDIKSSTRDIDFIISSKDASALLKLFALLGFKEVAERRWLTSDGIIIDMYLDDYIVNVKLLKPSNKDSTILRSFEHITVRILNFYDISITKIDRGDARDFQDIKVMLEKTDMHISLLIRKFILTMDHSESENPKFKLLQFVRFAEEQGYTILKEDKERIRQWQRI